MRKLINDEVTVINMLEADNVISQPAFTFINSDMINEAIEIEHQQAINREKSMR